MAEEKPPTTIQSSLPTLDDISVLRVLLHTVKGISSISTVNATAYDDRTA